MSYYNDKTKAKTVTNADVFYVTGAGYVNYPIRRVDSESPMGWEEPVWGNLNRSPSTFSFTNLDKVNFGVVFRFEVNIKFLSFEDYQVIRKLSKQRQFYIRGLNRDNGEFETHEMTFTKAELTKMRIIDNNYYGAFDTSLTMVATNRENAGNIQKEFKIEYDNNGGTGNIEPDVAMWSDLVVLSNNPQSIMSNAGYHIKEWNTKPDGSGESFGLGQQLTVWKDYKLYAIWEGVNNG